MDGCWAGLGSWGCQVALRPSCLELQKCAVFKNCKYLVQGGEV